MELKEISTHGSAVLTSGICECQKIIVQLMYNNVKHVRLCVCQMLKLKGLYYY